MRSQRNSIHLRTAPSPTSGSIAAKSTWSRSAGARHGNQHQFRVLNMSKPIAIRRASPADRSRLLAIQDASLRNLLADFYDRAVIDALIDAIIGNSSLMLDEMIASEHCFIADCGGALVGWGGWTARTSQCSWLAANLHFPPPHAEVRALYVDPAWLRRGFARRLLTAIEDDMAAKGHRQANLVASMSSIAFFRRLGYGVDATAEAKLPRDAPLCALDMMKVFEFLAPNARVNQTPRGLLLSGLGPLSKSHTTPVAVSEVAIAPIPTCAVSVGFRAVW